MPHASDLFILALGVLNQDEGTHHILGDLLEEEGDLGMAQWARAKKNNRYKRLDFVLGILPYHVALDCVAEFAIQAIKISTEYVKSFRTRVDYYEVSSCEPITSALANIQMWARREEMEESISRSLSVLANYQVEPYDIREKTSLMQSMHIATQCAVAADRLNEMGEYRDARKHALESRNAIRRAAKSARLVSEPAGTSIRLYRRYIKSSADSPTSEQIAEFEGAPYTNFFDWQNDFVRQTLAELIEAGAE